MKDYKQKRKAQYTQQRGEMPTKICASCNHCSDKYCSIYKRPIDTDKNRCFNHSYYKPNAKPFVMTKEMEIQIQADSAERMLREKRWWNEHNKMVDEIKKDIKTAKKLSA